MLTNYATLGNLFDTTISISNSLSIYALATNLVSSNTNLLSRIITLDSVRAASTIHQNNLNPTFALQGDFVSSNSIFIPYNYIR